MTRKQTSGLVYDKYGTPWDYIKDVDARHEEKYENLLENVIELSENVTDILSYCQSLEKKIEALSKPVKKPAVRKTLAKKNV